MARGSAAFQRNGVGAWWVIVDLPRDPLTGKRRQKWVKGRTRKAAESAARTLLAAIDAGTWVAESDQTVTAYLDVWMGARHRWRASTRARMAGVCRTLITPGLGTAKVQALTPVAVQRWLDGLRGSGASDSSLALAYGTLSAALAQAVRWQLLARNPCDAVEAPRYLPPERPTWDDDTARRFLAATADAEDGPLWAVAVYTGLRRGELLALTWGDVDLERRAVRVRSTLTKVPGGWTVGPTKTGAERDVPLRRAAVEALREQRDRQAFRRRRLGAAWQETGLVFDRGNGAYLPPDAVTHRWHSSLERGGWPRIHLHDLRHTTASLMRAAGVGEFEIGAILGHSRTRTTRHYLHVSLDQLRLAIDRMDA